MAEGFYHCTVKRIGKGEGLAATAYAYRHGTRAHGTRRGGKSAVAMAAYRCGEKMQDREREQVYDYTNRADSVRETIIVTPKVVPIWSNDHETLWNRAEQFDQRSNARIATELELALPHQFNHQQRRELVVDFVRKNFVEKYGVVVDIALHSAKEADHENEHAHVMLSHRVLGPDGFGDIANRHVVNKKIHGQYREVEVAGIAATAADIRQIREDWAKAVNRAYERAGLDLRADHRTLREQGILDRKPQEHLGPTLARALREREALDRAIKDREPDPPPAAPAARPLADQQESLDRAAAGA